MYFKTSHFLLVTFYAQMVSSQSVTLSKKGPPYYCKKDLKLKCQYSHAPCCDGRRIWRFDGSQIMSNGNESTTHGKYKETIDSTGKYFEITISNINEKDFGEKYECEYTFYTSNSVALQSDHLECFPCSKCAWRCFGWGMIPVVLTLIVLAFVICLLPLGIESRIVCFAATISVVVVHDLNLCMAVPIGHFMCICFDYSDSAYETSDFQDPYFISFILIIIGALLFVYLHRKLNCTGCTFKEYQVWIFLGWLTIGYVKLFYIIFKDCKVVKRSTAVLKCPYKETDENQIIWHKIIDNAEVKYVEKGDKIKTLPKRLQSRLTVIGDKGECHLSISKVEKSDEGTYQCSLPGKCFAAYRIKLTVEECDKSTCKKGLHYTGLLLLSICILPVPFMVIYYCCLKGENSQSVESGSSCWPICKVGQDPNTSSSDPEKVRRSPKKESADKKPTGFVRPQPSRAQHLGTDNTGRAEYSAENEMYSEKLLKSNKPRLPPLIGQQTDSPRPLPQMPASAQQGGNQLAPLEKKKKKRKKRREAKQSDEENSTEL